MPKIEIPESPIRAVVQWGQMSLDRPDEIVVAVEIGGVAVLSRTYTSEAEYDPDEKRYVYPDNWAAAPEDACDRAMQDFAVKIRDLIGEES